MDKQLPAAISPHLIKLCPSMDLVAVACESQLDVFRFNGQRAFGWTRTGSKCTIDSVAWLANGSGISIFWDDAIVDVVDSAQGKLASRNEGRPQRKSIVRGSTREPAKSRRVLGHSWSMNLIEPDLVIGKPETLQRSSALVSKSETPLDSVQASGGEVLPGLEQYYERIPDKDLVHAAADLPLQLALLDTDEELPQLSPLPHAEEAAILDHDPDNFSTHAGIEAAFYAKSGQDFGSNIIDVMVACWDDRATTLSCGGLTCQSELRGGALEALESPVGQASHPFTSCHAIVRQHVEAQRESLSIELFALNGLHRTGHLFNLISTKTKSLEQLSRYVMHCVLATRETWKISQTLPQRFISSIHDELAKRKQPISIEAALTHQAVTGSYVAEVREWLSEELQERGHKRWDAAVVNGYSQIIDLVHTHLLPALDCASVIASRLRGLCSMEPPVPLLKIPARNLSRILSNLDCLRLISHRILEYATEELRSSRVFLTWLQLQITITRAESNSTSASDAAEKAASLDHGLLLAYIEGPLRLSQLNYVLGRASEEVSVALRRPGDQLKRWLLIRILEKHDKEAMQPKPRDEGGSVEAVNVLWQALMLQDSIHEVVDASFQGFENDVESSGKVVLPGSSLAAESSKETRMRDVRMVAEKPALGLMCLYIVDALAEPATARLHRMLHHRHLSDISRSTELGVPNTGQANDPAKIFHLPILDIVPPNNGASVLIAFRFLTDDVILALTRQETSTSFVLELNWAYYGAAAKMIIDATDSAYTQLQPWKPSWKVIKRWASEDLSGFSPKLGCVETRLAVAYRGQTLDPNDATSKERSRRVVVCMLDDNGARYRVEEVEIIP